MARVVQVEVASQTNGSLFFPPLQRRIRGRFDARQNPSLEGGRLFARWPEPIPGQRLMIDVDEKRACVVEPLQEPENAAVARRVKDAGYALPPAVETFEGVDVATWCFWLKRALHADLAVLTSGELPRVPGKPRTTFVTQERPQRDGILNRLVALLVAKLAPKEFQAFEATLDSLEDLED